MHTFSLIKLVFELYPLEQPSLKRREVSLYGDSGHILTYLDSSSISGKMPTNLRPLTRKIKVTDIHNMAILSKFATLLQLHSLTNKNSDISSTTPKQEYFVLRQQQLSDNLLSSMYDLLSMTKSPNTFRPHLSIPSKSK